MMWENAWIIQWKHGLDKTQQVCEQVLNYKEHADAQSQLKCNVGRCPNDAFDLY